MKAYYSFYDIIEDVKSDISFANMRNMYSQIRKLICRAEFEINPYGGHLIKKRMIFFKGNGNFDGKNIKLPADFVSLDSNGMCQDGLCGNSILQTESHIVICDREKRDRVAFSYWANNSDSEGNPVVAMNHREAVVNFIIFKLYGAMVFNGEGAANIRREYKQEWEDSCMAARGFDLFPSEASLNNMHNSNVSSMREKSERYFIDYCSTDYCIDDSILNEKVSVFQLGLGEEFDLKNLGFILERNSLDYPKSAFVNGITVSFAKTGKYGFVIENSDLNNNSIVDILNNDIVLTMDKQYDYENKRIIFVSKDYVSPSSIYFKILQNA